MSYYYPPQKYPRSVQISHLYRSIKEYFDLKIITSEAGENHDNTLLNFTCLDGVDYVRKSCLTKFIEKSRGDRIKKAILPEDKYFWHFDILKNSIEIMESFKPDVIITFGQPMCLHIAGLKLKMKYPHIKWLAHFSDPWVDNLYNDYNSWVKYANKYYQNKVLHLCDRAIFTSLETIQLLSNYFPEEIINKTICLPHIYYSSLYRVRDKCYKKFTIRYLGNFYGGRQPGPLIEAINKLNSQEKEVLRVEIIGSINTDIQTQIKKLGVENVIIQKKAVSYLTSLSIMKSTDLLLIIDAPSDISPFLPSKLVDYIGANKPIFGITPPGTAQKLIEEMGFLTSDPNNPDEIAKKLSQMIKKIKSNEIKSIPENIRNRFSSANVGMKMKELINNVCEQ